MTDQFREAEATFSLLLEKFKEKKISQQEFADSLKQLRIKDDEGRFWVIGAQSGKWYAFENGEWIEAKPPSQMERKAICISCGFENDIEAESCARCGNRHDDAAPGDAGGGGPAARPPAAAEAVPAASAGEITRPLRRRHVVPVVLRRLRPLRRDRLRPARRGDRPVLRIRLPPARLLRRSPGRPPGRARLLRSSAGSWGSRSARRRGP